MTTFRSKSTSSIYDWGIYVTFVEAMNYALEHLSGVEVDGLPRFGSHIAFVRYNEEAQWDPDEPRSSSKPDIAVMSLRDAYELHQLDQTGGLKLSTFVDEIREKSPSGLTDWKTVLSAVEMERKKGSGWPELGAYDHWETQVGVMQDVCDIESDEKLEDTPPMTCKTNLRLRGHAC